MYFNELDQYLRRITHNETWHLEHPDLISPRYQILKTRKVKGKEYYYFDFTLDIQDHGLYIIKESRFTKLYPHFHKNIEMNYVYSGECTYTINDMRVNLKQGDICILEPNVIHSCEKTGENDIILTISLDRNVFDLDDYRQFDKNIIANMIANQWIRIREKNQFVVYRKQETTVVEFLLLSLVYIYLSQRDALFDYTIKNMIQMILTNLSELPFDTSYLEFTNKENQIISDILTYIKENYKNANLYHLAKQMNYNYTYLSNLITSKLQTSFSQLKLNQQIQQSKELLEKTDKSISAIIQDIGISNESYYYRKFKQLVGCSPSTYRNEKRH